MSTIPTKRRKKEDSTTILHRLRENGIEVEKQLKEFENLSSTNKDEATNFLMVVMKKFDLSKREMRACFPLTNRKWVQLRYNRHSNVKYNIQKIDSNIAGRLNNFLNNLKPQNEKVCEHHERHYFSRFKTINLLYEAYTTNDMYDKIKKTSFWKYLRERCPNFYTTCDTCMTKKRGRPRTERGDSKRVRLETLIPKIMVENSDTCQVQDEDCTANEAAMTMLLLRDYEYNCNIQVAHQSPTISEVIEHIQDDEKSGKLDIF